MYFTDECSPEVSPRNLAAKFFQPNPNQLDDDYSPNVLVPNIKNNLSSSSYLKVSSQAHLNQPTPLSSAAS